MLVLWSLFSAVEGVGGMGGGAGWGKGAGVQAFSRRLVVQERGCQDDRKQEGEDPCVQ